MSERGTPFIVRDLDDEAAIAASLEPQRLWTAYALADLEPPYRRHARYIGAAAGDKLPAIVLVYTAPGFTGLLPYGDTAGVEAIVRRAPDLPASPFLLVGEEHVDAVGIRYRLLERSAMHRMALSRAAFRPAPGRHVVVRLTPADAAGIRGLYAVEGLNPFVDEAILGHAVFFGAYREGELVAIAGTHTWSRRYRIGAIGGVFTRPDARGQGRATATTGAVAAALFDAGVDDVVLNVSATNRPALSAYSRLGFATIREFVEGEATS
jgi:GNAT superfamily N-acetyltransferase